MSDQRSTHSEASADLVGVRVFSGSRIDPSWTARTVLPVLAELSEQHAASRFRLARGWLNGPHVDVVATADTGALLPWRAIASDIVVPPADPARALDPATYLEQAREMGRLEQVPPPYLPMEEHGAVRLLTRADVDGWGGQIEALRDVVRVRLSGAAARTLMRTDGAPSVEAIAEAMVSVAAVHHGGLPFGTFSLRSHAEAFLSWSRPTRDVRPVFEQRRATDVSWLRALIAANLHGAHVTTPSNQDWRDSLAGSLGALDGGVASGALDPAEVDGMSPTYDSATMGPPGSGDSISSGPSEFHRRMAASGILDNPSPWFTAYRVLLNILYPQLLVLGVTPMLRYYLCYAIAETTDEVLGQTWQERIA